MKNEPWVRFGIFMRPKISENPADSRKRRPPSVTLLTASTSQTLTTGAPWSALQRRVVARVHRLSQEPLLVVGPELAHVGVGLDRGVDELIALALAAPDVEGAHHVPQVVEAERPPRGIGQRHRPKRPVERLAVLGLAARLLERRLRHLAVDVEAGRVEARDVAVLLDHTVDQALVGRRVEVAGVGRARDHAYRLVPEALHQRVVARRP